MITHGDILQFIDQIAPFETALDFDNTGLLLGCPTQPASGVMLALDATNDVLQQALDSNCSLVITHHPILFEPIKQLLCDSIAYQYIQANVSVISAHTNLDRASGGVGDCLAQALQLRNIREFAQSDGMGRMGELSKTMDAAELACYVGEKLGVAPRFTMSDRPIQTVAVLGGGGDFAWRAAKQAGADAFVTGESKHHILIAAEQAGFCYIDASHYATEAVVCEPLRQRIQAQFPQLNVATAKQSAPFRCINKKESPLWR